MASVLAFFQLLLVEISTDGFRRTFFDSQPLSEISMTDSVYAIETPQPVDEEPPSDAVHYVTTYTTVVVLNKHVSLASDGRRYWSCFLKKIYKIQN